MAALESKRSLSTAQGRGRAHAATKPVVATRKRPSSEVKPKAGKTGETTTRRYRWGRNFYRFEGLKGKVVEFAEFYTVGDYHSIDLRFSDKTMLHFVIEPGFTLETEHASVETGNWHCLKKWPEIRSARC